MYANINSNFNHIRLDLDRLLWTVCMLLWHCYLLSLLVFPHDMNMRPWIEHEVVGKYGFEINVNRHVHVYSLIFCYIVHLIKQWKEFNMLKKKMKTKKSTQISSEKKTIYLINSTKNNNVHTNCVDLDLWYRMMKYNPYRRQNIGNLISIGFFPLTVYSRNSDQSYRFGYLFIHLKYSAGRNIATWSNRNEAIHSNGLTWKDIWKTMWYNKRNGKYSQFLKAPVLLVKMLMFIIIFGPMVASWQQLRMFDCCVFSQYLFSLHNEPIEWI